MSSQRYNVVTLSVANGATAVTPNLDLRNWDLVAIHTPATLTSIAITFAISPDGSVTAMSVRDQGGSAISLTVAASRYTMLTQQTMEGMHGICTLTMGSAEGGARTLYAILRAR